jgi:nicotinamidase-related amidase
MEGEKCGLGVLSIPEPWAQEINSELVFIKHTYDAFRSGDMSVSLLAHLHAMNVTRIYMCGVLTKVS